MSQRNIRITVEYEGTAYCGWQLQPHERTIQGEITQAIFKVTGQRVNLIGAGRTDTGVHALGQVASFEIDHHLEPKRYKHALNHFLDDDIRVKKSDETDPGFHARFSALSRRYRYLVGREKSAVYRNQRWDYAQEIDLHMLKAAAATIVGEHDFRPFCVVASRQENNVCRIDQARWFQVGPLLVFEIRANRFLHSMVRSLVGAMINLATVNQDNNKQNLTLENFRDIINFRKDQRVVFTAPARGLYLVSVVY
ncbi:MAG: tRNA pseudouridine(38-40) synthase TruA [candidate division Zixibacteria bacterium]|nr:tRNA pseudouridine(38-40) synthase TruA [candidate division Zixibacteria bacterium]